MHNRRAFIKTATGVAAGTSLAGCTSTFGGDELENHEPVGPFELPIPNRSANPANVDAFNLIADQLGEIGIQIDLNTMEVAAWVEALLSDPQDSVVNRWSRTGSPDRIDPFVFLNENLHSQGIGEGTLNHAYYSDDEMDQMIEDSNVETDEEARRELVNDIQEKFGEDVPYIMSEFENVLGVANNEWEGWEAFPGTELLHNRISLTEISPTTDASRVVKAQTQTVDRLNWGNFSDSSIHSQVNVAFDSLVQLWYDGSPQPALATEWEWSDDTTLEVTLRDDITFHDGEPITAEDVKFTYEIVDEWAHGQYQSLVQQISEIEAVDEQTVRFNLEDPAAYLVRVTLSQVTIAPKHVWEDVDDPAQVSDPDYTGSGPLKVTEFGSEQIRYEVHDDYYRDYDFDEYVVQVYGAESAAIGDVESGTATFYQSPGPTEFTRLQEVDSVTTIEQPTVSLQAFCMNNSVEPFDDRTLRQACAHAIDQEAIVQTAYQNFRVPAVGQTFIAPINEDWRHPDPVTYEGGAEEARSILEDTGYVWNDDEQLMRPSEETEE
ncbi:ABC transporter substrate-binding protein [Halorubrum trueperi]|uniref:ABC transporter substrate-binding protein n=1 Tax=Halorubrum trueperi TaxID=2004704 RepID=A0ABD5UKP3_9EURY